MVFVVVDYTMIDLILDSDLKLVKVVQRKAITHFTIVIEGLQLVRTP